MIDAHTLFRELTAYLEAAGIPDADFDVRCLFEQVAGKRLEQIFLSGLPAEDENPLRNMTQRRAFREPLQYILGEWEFYGMRLFVGKGVLIPRPDTETLVDAVLERCRNQPAPRILDLCTGSGCIALALQKHLPGAEVHAVDLSDIALTYAQKNADYHRLPVRLHHGDVQDADFAAEFRDFDVIVSNPPYLDHEDMANLQTEVRHEPALALAAGEDGMRFYRSITNLWKSALKPGGLLAYEIGETQGARVQELLISRAFQNVQILKDLAKNDRVVLGRSPEK